MRLLLIRHGDPNYEHNCLTPQGRLEAAALAEYLRRERIDFFYVSPLGRAQETAGYTLRAMGREAVTLDWLREFPVRLDINDSPVLQAAFPDTPRKSDGNFPCRVAWDILPRFYYASAAYHTQSGWHDSDVARHSDMDAVYARVCRGLDDLLAEHGYVPEESGAFRVERSNDDTLALFCHFGLTCVLLSRLWGVSPFVLWHSLAAAPTSITELYTEEREKGIALWRCTRFGDCSHLYAAGIQPSFSGRFCERFEDDARH